MHLLVPPGQEATSDCNRRRVMTLALCLAGAALQCRSSAAGARTEAAPRSHTRLSLRSLLSLLSLLRVALHHVGTKLFHARKLGDDGVADDGLLSRREGGV